MDEIRHRIEEELQRVMDRLRQMGGAMVTEEFPNATDHNSPFADLMDKVQVHEELEISVATTNLLVERANRLAAALERLREGEYGICEECGEAISPARLRAMPEVTTCVCCQDRLERTSRQLAQAAVAVLKVLRTGNRRHLQGPSG